MDGPDRMSPYPSVGMLEFLSRGPRPAMYRFALSYLVGLSVPLYRINRLVLESQSLLERFTIGLHTQALPRPEGPQEPSPGWNPGNRSPRARLVHPEGVPEGLLRPFRPPEI